MSDKYLHIKGNIDATLKIEDTSPPLLLNIRKLRANAINLFEELQENEELAQEFIENPTEIVANRIAQQKIPIQQASEANRLLFSLLANDEMREWLESYPEENAGKRVSKSQFAADFAQAVARIGDKNIHISLLNNAALGYGIPGLTDIAYQIIINNSAGSAVATPVSEAQEAKSSQNFNGFPSGGNITPAIMRMITERMIEYAIQLRDSGVLANLNQQIR